MKLSEIYNKIFNTLKFIMLPILLLFNTITLSHALDVTLKWVQNDEPNVAGYKVFYREENQPYNFANPEWECTEPICTIYDLDKTKTHYFVVRAFDMNGYESANSSEVRIVEGIPDNQAATTDSGGGGGCFIATAAYGSLMEPHVKILRNFRDRFLIGNTIGDCFVHLYYTYSPPVADFIRKHDNLRAIMRVSLLPVVGIS